MIAVDSLEPTFHASRPAFHASRPAFHAPGAMTPDLPATQSTISPPADPELVAAIKHYLSDVSQYSRLVMDKPLRPYQAEPACAIVDSVLQGRGLTFAVMMARQAGKNELSGQLEAYLLTLCQRRGGQIVKASPTFKPQTINSLLRLADRLDTACNRCGSGGYRRREGYIIEVGAARALFFSAEPTAKVVGATADLLLEGDEAQEITPDKWYKDFSPMAASQNATTVLYGTAWTSDTFLARTVQHLRQQEAKDGVRRVFAYDADQVADRVPAYGRYVDQQVERLVRDHPLIRSQNYLEAVDARSGLFPPARRALMRGDHQRRHGPAPVLSGAQGARRHYALLLDVAGEEETPGAARFPGAYQLPLFANRSGLLAQPARDATALTVVEVEPRPGALPRYRTVDRRHWLGVRHAVLHERICALVEQWRAAWLVVDATGVGAGLASFLAAALGQHRSSCRVLPVVFSSKVKSDLGWNFVGAVETGRYRDYSLSEGEADDADTRQFWYEVEHCQYEVLPGPGERIRWGVWESPAYGGLIARGHDDLLLSAALCTVLDEQNWPATGPAEIVQRDDPLAEIDRTAW